MLISIVINKLIIIINLDVFNKQSVNDLNKNFNIDILQESLTSSNIYHLFIANDEEVFNI